MNFGLPKHNVMRIGVKLPFWGVLDVVGAADFFLVRFLMTVCSVRLCIALLLLLHACHSH